MRLCISASETPYALSKFTHSFNSLSEIGVTDLGYMGNRPNQWNGVPDDVLKQYGLAYSERELKE